MRIIHPDRPAGEVTVSGIAFTDGVAEIAALDEGATAVLTAHGFTFESSTPLKNRRRKQRKDGA